MTDNIEYNIKKIIDDCAKGIDDYSEFENGRKVCTISAILLDKYGGCKYQGDIMKTDNYKVPIITGYFDEVYYCNK
jgi:hypothetical protein